MAAVPVQPLEALASGADPDSGTLDRVFSAVADPVRRAILMQLDGRDLLVSQLAAPFDISLQAVSRHIQVLVRAGLVNQERTGRISRCRLDAGPIFEAALWLNRYSKYWQSQFDTLAAWLDAISPATGESAHAVLQSQPKSGRSSPGNRRVARKNSPATAGDRAGRGRKLPVRGE